MYTIHDMDILLFEVKLYNSHLKDRLELWMIVEENRESYFNPWIYYVTYIGYNSKDVDIPLSWWYIGFEISILSRFILFQLYI